MTTWINDPKVEEARKAFLYILDGMRHTKNKSYVMIHGVGYDVDKVIADLNVPGMRRYLLTTYHMSDLSLGH